MIEKIGSVKNPLTVIAIFAGLAEVSGTVVLPFINDAVQGTFVWFLMGFPLLLVILFFGTLWAKPVVLYAPSDYRDERIFENLFVPTKPEDRTKEIEEEAAIEIEAEKQTEAPQLSRPAPTSVSSPTNDISVGLTTNDFGIFARAAEDYAISKLEQTFGVSFGRQVSSRETPDVRFDAVSTTAGKIMAVEVRYTRVGRPSSGMIEKILNRVDKFYEALHPQQKARFQLVLVYVVDRAAMDRIEYIKRRVEQAALAHSFPSRVEVFGFAELEREFGPHPGSKRLELSN